MLAVRRVGLSVSPPATSVGNRCATPQNANYNSKSSAYTIVALSKDYRLSNGQLDSGSDLVKTLNCVQGNGTTAYADAIEAAQKELDKNDRPEVQDVVVFLSDGAANTGPSYYSSSSAYRMKPCHQGITSAGYSKSKGAIVYALDDDTGGCAAYAESPKITVYQALQGIASPGNFYNRPDAGQLNTIYAAIAADIKRGSSALIYDEAQ